jgi:DNA-binding NarL/FixJ family response regulator
MDKIRILLVDDHILLRQGTAELLQREGNIQVVGEANNGEEAVALAEQLHPEIIIMDVRMPKLSGIDATRRIRSEMPEIQVLILTAYDDDEYVFSLLQAGASGYILKTAPIADLLTAIQQVRAGESPLAPSIAKKVVARFSGGGAHNAVKTVNIDQLTAREVEILQYLARGSSNREIGEALFISDRTVQAHLTNIFAKMQVTSRLEAVLKGIRLGWLALGG